MNNTTMLPSSLFQSSELLSSLTIAFILFVLGLILGRVLGRIVERLLKEFKVGLTLKKKTGMRFSFERVASTFVSYSIYIVFFMLALNKIGVTAVILNIVAIVILLVLSISLILSIKDSVPNIIAYRKISNRKDVKAGRHLTVQNITGVIEEVTVFEIRVQTRSGDIIHVPNSMLMNEVYTIHPQKHDKT